MVYSGARGTLIYEKNLKSKFSCQTPFNVKWVLILSIYALYRYLGVLTRVYFIQQSAETHHTQIWPVLSHPCYNYNMATLAEDYPDFPASFLGGENPS